MRSSGSGAGAGAAAGAAQPYRPDGLDSQYHGTSDNETIDKMQAALKGYRDRDASRDIPTNADGYLSLEGLKDFKLDAAMQPHFDALKDDPAAKAMFATALKHGMPRQAVLEVWQDGMKGFAEAGLLEQIADPVAERAKLLPETAKGMTKDKQDAAIDARLQANQDFLDLLAKPGENGAKGKIAPEVAKHAGLMLMDTADGNLFLEAVRDMATGGGLNQPLTTGGQASTAESQREALRAELAADEMQPQHPKFDRAKWDALNAKYQRLVG